MQNKPTSNNRRRGRRDYKPRKKFVAKEWVPITQLGRDVHSKKYATLHEVVSGIRPIKEPEIIDHFNINFDEYIINVKRVVRMTGSGGRMKTSLTMALLSEGLIGLTVQKGKGMFDVKEKCLKAAKKNLSYIPRGCGSFSCNCGTNHTLLRKVTGKCGSLKIKLLPAPRGSGLAIGEVGREILLKLGVKDVYSKSFGHTKTKKNYAFAIYDALKKLNNFVDKKTILDSETNNDITNNDNE